MSEKELTKGAKRILDDTEENTGGFASCFILDQDGPAAQSRPPFQDVKGPVTFCTDKSLGMGLHIKEGQEMRRWNPIFSDLDQDLDQPRQPGEYPPWFKHYKEAAKKTKHGLLILQLTDSYLKSKACRWEFGYVRKPELVHVYVPSGDKSPGRIVKWEELMEDAELCKQLFGEALGRTFQANLDAEDPTMQGTFTQLEKMAETAEEQEHQAWCELPFRQLAYNFAANTFGEESVTTMPSADNLIAVFNQTGFAAKAEQIGKDLLERKENQFGKDHFFVATTLALLGSAHGDLGNYSQQKDLLERALRILEQRYGKDHPEVALTLASLGNAHGDLGNYSQQKDLFERALRIKEQHYGKEHPEVAKTLTNLSNAHGYLGYYSQQKDLLEHALRIKEQHYGKEHPEVAVTLTNLGNAHGSLGDYSQQKDLLERALRIKEQHFGKEHPEVAITVYNLGEAHDDLGDLRRAKELVERAFKIFVHHGSPYAERAQRRLAQMEVKMMPSVRPSVPRGFVEAVRRSTQDGEDLQKALALSLETVEDNEDLQKALALSEPLEDVEDPELREDLALSVSPLHAGS